MAGEDIPKIINPATGRLVSATGAIGRKILKAQGVAEKNEAKLETMPEAKAKPKKASKTKKNKSAVVMSAPVMSAPVMPFNISSREEFYTVKAYGGVSAFRSNPASVAVFDMDGTLIRPKGDYVFPKTLDDWRWIKTSADGASGMTDVKAALKALHENGHDLIIMTNQKKLSAADITTKVQMLYDDLQVPFVLVAGHKDDFYRKPHTGLWKVVTEQLGPVDMAKKSFFVGDMETDAYFAHNVGLKFHWADDYFQFDSNGKIKHELPPHPLEGLVHSPEVKYASSATKHLVVLMGAAASGKSSIARQLEGYALINRDTMKTDAKMKKAFEAAIAADQSIVVDNTNPAASSREPWLTAAKKAGYKTTIIFVDLPKPAAIFLNEYRYEVSGGTASYVPTVAYNIFYSKLERPVASEADEVITTQLNVSPEVKRAMLGRWF